MEEAAKKGSIEPVVVADLDMANVFNSVEWGSHPPAHSPTLARGRCYDRLGAAESRDHGNYFPMARSSCSVAERSKAKC
jgi:hypothetical protein